MIDITPFERAIEQLEISLQYSNSDLAKQDSGIAKQFRAATIQAFEYTYELAHKTLKRYLEQTEATSETIDELTFQDLVRTGAEKGLLLNSWHKWRTYREARGTTSHTYHEEFAEKVFTRIPEFLNEARYLLDEIRKRQIKRD